MSSNNLETGNSAQITKTPLNSSFGSSSQFELVAEDFDELLSAENELSGMENKIESVGELDKIEYGKAVVEKVSSSEEAMLVLRHEILRNEVFRLKLEQKHKSGKSKCEAAEWLKFAHEAKKEASLARLNLQSLHLRFEYEQQSHVRWSHMEKMVKLSSAEEQRLATLNTECAGAEHRLGELARACAEAERKLAHTNDGLRAGLLAYKMPAVLDFAKLLGWKRPKQQLMMNDVSNEGSCCWWIIRVVGTPKEGGGVQRFNISLVDGANNSEETAMSTVCGDIAATGKLGIPVHFDARFNYGHKKWTIMNSYHHKGDQGWALEEEAKPAFPFEYGKEFIMELSTADGKSVKATVDGKQYMEYKSNVSRVDRVEVHGCVEVSLVELIDHH